MAAPDTTTNPRTARYVLIRDDGAGERIIGRYIGFAQAMSAWDAASPGGEADFDDETLYVAEEKRWQAERGHPLRRCAEAA